MGKHSTQKLAACALALTTNEQADAWRMGMTHALRRRQVSEGGDSVPARWAAGRGGEDAKRSFNAMPAAKPKLPQQDNHCDCGLFLLAYLAYFVAGLPARVALPSRAKIDHAELEGAARTHRPARFLHLNLPWSVLLRTWVLSVAMPCDQPACQGCLSENAHDDSDLQTFFS
jgi:hypothetical protein